MRLARAGAGKALSVNGRDPFGGFGAGAVTDVTFRYSGPGFSLLGDKSRFVLPSKFRKTLKESNGGAKTLYIDKHPFFPCLIGFGEPYQAMLEADVSADNADARTRELR